MHETTLIKKFQKCTNAWNNNFYYKFKRRADSYSFDELAILFKGLTEVRILCLPGTWKWEQALARRFPHIKFTFLGLEIDLNNWLRAKEIADTLGPNYQMYHKHCSLYTFLHTNPGAEFDLVYADFIGPFSGDFVKVAYLIAKCNIIPKGGIFMYTCNMKRPIPKGIRRIYVTNSAVVRSSIAEPFCHDTIRYVHKDGVIVNEVKCKLNWLTHKVTAQDSVVGPITAFQSFGYIFKSVSIQIYGTTENPKTSVMSQNILVRQ